MWIRCQEESLKVMKRSQVTIGVLAAALVISNGYWAYSSLDRGVTFTYQQVTLESYRDTARAAVAIFPHAVSAGATRESILAEAMRIGSDSEPFEKEGCVWVSPLGYRFSDDGALLEIAPMFDPF